MKNFQGQWCILETSSFYCKIPHHLFFNVNILKPLISIILLIAFYYSVCMITKSDTNSVMFYKNWHFLVIALLLWNSLKNLLLLYPTHFEQLRQMKIETQGIFKFSHWFLQRPIGLVAWFLQWPTDSGACCLVFTCLYSFPDRKSVV